MAACAVPVTPAGVGRARKLRFGVMTTNAPDGRTWRERARRAEALGYTTLFMADHLHEQWAPTVGLTIAAEATQHLKVATLVYCNDYRHPVVLAKEIATLDLATEGRVEFGLGAGWLRADYERAGIPYDAPGVRIERMFEALEVMRALWSSTEPVTFRGRHYDVRGAVGTPRPHSRPHPPVCIGGGGRRILSLAAREADIIGLNATLSRGELGREVSATATSVAFDEKVSWILAAAGDRIADIELQCHCAFAAVGPNRAELAATMAPMFSITPEEALDVPIALMGSVDELCDTIAERRERYGFTYWIVPDRAMDAFAPVVARLAGT
jgi:probable F420-dependent oxidoreductase